MPDQEDQKQVAFSVPHSQSHNFQHLKRGFEEVGGGNNVQSPLIQPSFKRGRTDNDQAVDDQEAKLMHDPNDPTFQKLKSAGQYTKGITDQLNNLVKQT